jgi:ABC-type polysaccharide/polyol phosphate transport system ATPase subunit
VYLKCETADIIGFRTNGSGKSTVLKIIFQVAADFKFVRVDGVVKSKPAIY